MDVTAFDIAQRFIGMKEVPGHGINPGVLAMLQLDAKWPKGDDVPWCSAFVNYVAWLLRLPRSKSLRARSWLQVGVPIPPSQAEQAFDVVILKRGDNPQPGPNIIDAPGHVGFFAGLQGVRIYLLGGNQGDMVSVQGFPKDRVLGVRRLA
jgi:uncharacterized protein (TIGR02594 family)